jgi:hypothetical protein
LEARPESPILQNWYEPYVPPDGGLLGLVRKR